MQLTRRDEDMLTWLHEVRIADLDGVRWALGAFRGTGQPVVLRVAQHWVARMVSAGLVGKARPAFLDGSLVWATRAATGRTVPNLMRQTTRHQVAVARASARFLAHGYAWANDRKPVDRFEHRADGAAVFDDVLDLVEVELTAKADDRYRVIFTSHATRLTHEGIGRVIYLCDARSARNVRAARDRELVADLAGRVVVLDILDDRGNWKFDWSPQLDGRAGVDAEPVMNDRLFDAGTWTPEGTAR